VIPAQSDGREGDPGHAFVRLQVVRTALEAGLQFLRKAWPKRSGGLGARLCVWWFSVCGSEPCGVGAGRVVGADRCGGAG